MQARCLATFWILLLVLLPSMPGTWGQDEDPAATALRAKVLKTERAKLEKSLDRTIKKVAGVVGDGAVALLRVQPVLEAESAAPAGALLDALLQRAFLLGGVLVSDIEAEAPIPAVYAHGKLSSKSRVHGDLRARLQDERHLQYALEASWLSKGGRYEIAYRLQELATRRTKAKGKLARIDANKVPLADIVSVRPLPDANKAVLLFAIGMLGRSVDRGECWDLPAHPLIAMGRAPNGYDFGERVSFVQALPGDVVTIDAHGEQHVMVLWKKGNALGSSTILHQNWDQKRFVMVAAYPPNVILDAIIWRPGS